MILIRARFKSSSHYTICLLWLMLVISCKERRPARVIDRAFYYWKSSFDISRTEHETLTNLHVNRLYVKFFDVAWNDLRSEPMPLAILKINAKQSQQSYSIIPTIFITNDCMTKVKESQIKELAEKIILLIKTISSTNNIKILPEIQMDCDWSANTKDKYFLLLQRIKGDISDERTILSATVRLYQYKYRNKAGIPPVDRGLLMCYNMGNLKNPDTRNSILDQEELNKYLNAQASYPLPLDIALPIFDWKVLFRSKKYNGLINELPTRLLENNPAVKRSVNKYEILQPLSAGGYQFQPGDLIRDEEVTFKDLINAESSLTKKLATQHLSVILYHLDSITLSKFSMHELETVFNYLH